MRRFELHRYEDETGVSGTGVVAQGVEFRDGPVALRWIVGEHRSTVVWPSMEAVEAVHGHNGKTRIVWIDPETSTARCDAVAVLTGPFEVVRCDGASGHDRRHFGHDSAATPLLWEGDAVRYSDVA